VKASIDDVWRFLLSEEGLALWLGEGIALPLEKGQTYETAGGTTGEIRSLRPHDRVRLTWKPRSRQKDATVQIALTATRSGTTIRFHTERLDNAEEREQMRRHWVAIADEVEGNLPSD
jgi:uncharacterized protein YndB with AHSA1/START domain